ncbi:MAG: peptidoglycan DD-metalloendopeptidase family protein [Proteobacteria bacterium]|nr:peptidoglycan DD-metalloendopeptidase family protein [Pseudomonadota bacterium]
MKRATTTGFVLLFFLFLLAGCMIRSGVVHRVGAGETLWRICKTYGVDIGEVVKINDIGDPTEIRTGAKIFIPGVKRLKRVTPASSMAKTKGKNGAKRKVKKGERLFSWPIKGTVSSRFGTRGSARHDGLDIRAPKGTSIKAAERGKVVFVSKSYDKYGRIIILEHNNDYFTVYAHNSKNSVKLGQSVAKGQSIGKVGKSGNATGYHLHFEVRKGKQVLNPLFFLP